MAARRLQALALLALVCLPATLSAPAPSCTPISAPLEALGTAVDRQSIQVRLEVSLLTASQAQCLRLTALCVLQGRVSLAKDCGLVVAGLRCVMQQPGCGAGRGGCALTVHVPSPLQVFG